MSSASPFPFGDPSPGIDLSESHAAEINAVTLALTVAATVAVVLRLFARARVQGVPIKADDWLIVTPVVPAYAGLACTILGGKYGLGRHIWALSLDQIWGKIIFTVVLLYYWSMLLLKLSIVTLYRRIFAMTCTLYLCAFLAVGYFISCSVAFSPVAGRPHTSGRAVTSTDVLIIIVPVRPVWKLQMRTVQKVLVLGVFSLGSLYVVDLSHPPPLSLSLFLPYTATRSSPFRQTCASPPQSASTTWSQRNIFIWSTVETCVGIVSACLPTLHPLARRTLERIIGLAFRPDGDEALLTTRTTIETDDLRGMDVGILVETDFHWSEEHT
ncbi:hypothetical protein BDV10DRAFT_194402 [Aspergillus recurvatus]